MLYVPGEATEPLIVGELKVSPAGRTAAVNDVGEFVAVMIYEKKVPAVTVAVNGLEMTGAAPTGVTERTRVLLSDPDAFVAPSAMLYVPGVVTEPLMVGELKVSPTGRAVAVNDVGEFVAVRVYEKEAPATTDDVSGLDMTGAAPAGVTVRTRILLSRPAAFAAPIAMLYVPGAATEPLIVDELKVSPLGREVAVYDVGEFVPVMVYEKGDPATTDVVSGLAITGAAPAGVTVRTSVLLSEPNAFIAPIAILYVPGVATEPVIVGELNVSPVGRAVARTEDRELGTKCI
jgi:hypothetical protein